MGSAMYLFEVSYCVDRVSDGVKKIPIVALNHLEAMQGARNALSQTFVNGVQTPVNRLVLLGAEWVRPVYVSKSVMPFVFD